MSRHGRGALAALRPMRIDWVEAVIGASYVTESTSRRLRRPRRRRIWLIVGSAPTTMLDIRGADLGVEPTA